MRVTRYTVWTTVAVVGLLLSVLASGLAADADGDGIPDHVEARIGTDPGHPETFEVIHGDGVRGEGDKSVGKQLVPHGDFTRISFCPVARRRFVWKIDFAAPFPSPAPAHDVTILYLDVDNNPDTGRPDAGPGCDLMLRPGKGTRLIGWEGEARTTGCFDGTSLYLVADIALNQEDGQSVYRMMFLYQDTRKEHLQNRDSMSWMVVKASGAPERSALRVPEKHPLYRPPVAIARVAVRMPFDLDPPQAELTFITSWPARTTIQYGATVAYGAEVREDRASCNHRVFLSGLAEGDTIHYRVVCRTLDGEVTTPDATFVFARPVPAPGRVARDTVVLTARNDAATPAQACPFTVGLPFPQGTLSSDRFIRLLGRDGGELPLQSQVTARWSDGTAKWLLLDFTMDVSALGQTDLTLEYGNEVQRGEASSGVMLTEDDGSLRVDTGRIRALFGKGEGRVLRQVWLDADADGAYEDGEALMAEEQPSGPVLTDAEGTLFRAAAAPRTIEVERHGPVYTVVRVTGTHAAPDGSAMFEYISRYHFSLGSALIRLQHTIANDRVKRKLTMIRQVGIRLPLRFTGSAQVTCELRDGEAATFRASEGRLRISQDLDNRWSLASPTGSAEAEGGAGWFQVAGGGVGVWVGLRHFREMYPNELVFDHETMTAQVNVLPAFPPTRYGDLGDAVESDRLYYHLRDGGYRLYRGVSFTHDVWLGFFRDGSDTPAQWATQLGEPLIAQAPPEWYCESGAFGEQLARRDGRFTHYEAMVERGFTELLRRRELYRSFGFLNFGDWWGERRFNWGNIEYDTQHLQMVQFIRTGDRKFFDNACYAATHNRDVDFVHHGVVPTHVGRTRAHCMFHTGGYEPRMTAKQRGLASPKGHLTGPLSGHQWTRGLFEHHFMTGEVRSRRTALALSDYLAGPGTINWTMGYGAERAAAWAIFAVLAAYESSSYDPFYLNAARIQVEDVIRRQNPKTGHWDIPAGYSKVVPTPIGGYAWCTGLIITAMEHYNRYAKDPRVDETILRAAEWLARDEYVPEKKGFRACSCETFNVKTRPGGSCWTVSNALAHAYELSGNERFLDLAQMGYAMYAKTGATGIGKSYSTGLVTSHHLIAKLHRAGRDDLDPTRWEDRFEMVSPRVLIDRDPGKPTLLLRTLRDDSVRVEIKPAGRPSWSIELRPGSGWQTVELDPPADGSKVIRGEVSCDTQVRSFAIRSDAPQGATPIGQGVGLIAGTEDFLGPALRELGIEHIPIKDLTALSQCKVVFVGTQACTLNAAGLRADPAPLLQWLHAGGTAVLSQPNDDGWDAFLLGNPLIMQEPNSVSGSITVSDHELFKTPHAIAELSGASMYDSIAYVDDAWTVFMKDSGGRPAVVEARVGSGRVLVIVPSFDRYVSGALAGPDKLVSASRQFFENVLAYARRH